MGALPPNSSTSVIIITTACLQRFRGIRRYRPWLLNFLILFTKKQKSCKTPLPENYGESAA